MFLIFVRVINLYELEHVNSDYFIRKCFKHNDKVNLTKNNISRAYHIVINHNLRF